MALTAQEFWTIIHGMILGSLFLLVYAGGLAGLKNTQVNFSGVFVGTLIFIVLGLLGTFPPVFEWFGG